jgi:Zn-dependent protease with chaperone function
VAGPLASEASRHARPDVLAYPSPTTSRYLIFVAALLASGLFVGNYVHSMVWGDSWQQTVSVCLNRTADAPPSALVESSRAFESCTAGVERTRALVTALGAVAVGAAGVGLMWLAPVVVTRRRRLRPLPAPLSGAAERFAELARGAGVTARVVPVLGPTQQRDGFSYGAPGSYRVALPPAVAVRWADPSVFDPLVGHELAHVRHRDVPLAWLTRLVWWALVPLLALPVVVGLVRQDYSILGGYSWRVTLLAAVVALLSSQLLRTREHDADLRAAQLLGGPAAVADLVGRLPRREESVVRRFLARHPRPGDRVAVLGDPVLATRTGFVDGLTGGFLSAAALPLVVAALTPALAGIGYVVTAYLLAAALLGPMLAGSVGLGLWRAALVRRLEGARAPTAGVAAGTGLGLVLGQAVSLQQAGLGTLTGLTEPVWLLVTGLAGAGAVVVSSALGRLWADLAPRLPGPRPAWLASLALNSLLFATLLWACSLFQASIDLGGWSLARQTVPSTLSPWWVVGVALLLAAGAVTALVLRAPGQPAPRWLVEAGEPTWPGGGGGLLARSVVVGLVAGGCGAAAVVAFRLGVGPTGVEATMQRFWAYQWVAALTAAAVLVVLVLADRDRGAGASLPGALVAVAGVVLGFHTLNMSLGARPDLQLVAQLLRPGVVIGLYACLLAAPIAAALAAALDPLTRALPPRPAWLVPVALVVPFTVAGAATALGVRDVLVGPADGQVAVTDPTSSELPGALATEVSNYELEVVPDLLGAYGAAAGRAEEILADPTGDDATRVRRFDTEVLAPMDDLVERMELLPVGDARLAAAHAEALEGLTLATERFALLRDVGATADDEVVAQLTELQTREAEHWQSWVDQRAVLLDEVLAGQ